jgi:hypothetical protein
VKSGVETVGFDENGIIVDPKGLKRITLKDTKILGDP